MRPSNLVRLLGLPLVCLAMFAVAGGHWAILQSVAWTQMVISYSAQTGSLSTAVEQTFSGKYPCPMCKRLAEGKKQEEKAPTALKVDKKTEGFLVAFIRLPAPLPTATLSLSIANTYSSLRAHAPPQPVPRASLSVVA